MLQNVNVKQSTAADGINTFMYVALHQATDFKSLRKSRTNARRARDVKKEVKNIVLAESHAG